MDEEALCQEKSKAEAEREREDGGDEERRPGANLSETEESAS